jgi:heterotetrameric sarcosine oxidase gamma subunit
MAKASIILWRTAPDRFYVNVWRSFMPYLWDYLVEARTRL